MCIRDRAKRLSGLDDDYMGERARDVIEMQKELMTALRGDSPGYLWNEAGGEDPEKPAILLAEDFMPSDAVSYTHLSLCAGESNERAAFAPLSESCTRKAAALILAVPNGVQRMSDDIPGLVETSLNVGVNQLSEKELLLSYAVRSSVSTAFDALLRCV